MLVLKQALERLQLSFCRKLSDAFLVPTFFLQSILFYRIINSLLESGCSATAGPVQTPEAVVIAPTRELAIQTKVM